MSFFDFHNRSETVLSSLLLGCIRLLHSEHRKTLIREIKKATSYRKPQLLGQPFLENSFNQFLNTALHVGVVGNRSGNGRVTGTVRSHTLLNQCSCINEEPGADAFF